MYVNLADPFQRFMQLRNRNFILVCTVSYGAKFKNEIIDCIDYATGIGNLHMRNTGTPCYGQRVKEGEKRGFSSSDLCAGRQNNTLHGRSSRQYDKGIGVRAGGGCARNDCKCARRQNIECQ